MGKDIKRWPRLSPGIPDQGCASSSGDVYRCDSFVLHSQPVLLRCKNILRTLISVCLGDKLSLRVTLIFAGWSTPFKAVFQSIPNPFPASQPLLSVYHTANIIMRGMPVKMYLCSVKCTLYPSKCDLMYVIHVTAFYAYNILNKGCLWSICLISGYLGIIIGVLPGIRLVLGFNFTWFSPYRAKEGNKWLSETNAFVAEQGPGSLWRS